MLTHQADTYEVALSPEESIEKFGMTITENAVLIKEFKKFSGTMNPKALLGKLHEAIRRKGNVIKYDQKATKLIKEKDWY